MKRATLVNGAALGVGGVDGAARGLERDTSGGVVATRGAGRGASEDNGTN